MEIVRKFFSVFLTLLEVAMSVAQAVAIGIVLGMTAFVFGNSWAAGFVVAAFVIGSWMGDDEKEKPHLRQGPGPICGPGCRTAGPS